MPDAIAIGCYVALFDFIRPEPLYIFNIGNFRTKMQERVCIEYCLEKGRRLQLHPEHISSYQTRDFLTKPWQCGGAVRGSEIILSCAGFPELKDELAMIRAGLRIGRFPSDNHVRDIANLSENMDIYHLLKSLAV